MKETDGGLPCDSEVLVILQVPQGVLKHLAGDHLWEEIEEHLDCWPRQNDHLYNHTMVDTTWDGLTSCQARRHTYISECGYTIASVHLRELLV